MNLKEIVKKAQTAAETIDDLVNRADQYADLETRYPFRRLPGSAEGWRGIDEVLDLSYRGEHGASKAKKASDLLEAIKARMLTVEPGSTEWVKLQDAYKNVYSLSGWGKHTIRKVSREWDHPKADSLRTYYDDIYEKYHPGDWEHFKGGATKAAPVETPTVQKAVPTETPTPKVKAPAAKPAASAVSEEAAPSLLDGIRKALKTTKGKVGLATLGALGTGGLALAKKKYDEKNAQEQPKLLDKLKEVKSLSDDKKYDAKANKLVSLIKADPGSFFVDSEEGNFVGITHSPTGFRFHLPRKVISGMSIKRAGDEEDVKEAMTMEDIANELNEYGHPEMNIGGGAAMVLRGMRDSTADIDASIDDELFDEILGKYEGVEPKTSTLGSRVFTIPGSHIDLHSSIEGEVPGDTIDGVTGRVETESELLKFYRKLDRAKDQKWIKMLEERMEPDKGALERIKESQAKLPSQLVSRWCWGFKEACDKAGVDPVELMAASELKTLSLAVE